MLCACLLLFMTGNRTMAEERMDELKKRTPMDLSFKQLWKRRFVFDAELPFPKDVTFLPCGHYAADVTSLPAEMQLVTKDGDVKMRVEAPSDVTPPYTFHVAFCGKSRCGVYVTKDGVTKLYKLAPLPNGFDPRDKNWTTELVMRSHGGMGDVKKTLTAGMGQADVRFVTRGRQNALYWEDGRLFFTFSVRIFGGFQGVASFDPAKLDVRLEGTILFDYGDGKLRNDANAQPTGMFCLDVDIHHEPEFKDILTANGKEAAIAWAEQEARERAERWARDAKMSSDLWPGGQPDDHDLDILGIHISPSGTGVHVIACCNYSCNTIAENQARLARLLGTSYDAVCKDWARIFFLTPREDWTYLDLDNIFGYE